MLASAPKRAPWRRSVIRDALRRGVGLMLALALALLGIDAAMLRVSMPAHFHQVASPVAAERPIDLDTADVVYVADDASSTNGTTKLSVVTTDGIVPCWVLQWSRLDAALIPPAGAAVFRSLVSEPPDPPPRQA